MLVGTTLRITQRLAARLEDASLTYLVALSCMTEAERNAVRAGTLEITDYVAKRWRRPVINVDELVAECPEHVLAALNRLTAPAAGDGLVARNGDGAAPPAL
jgi:hypothetical protein